MRRLPTIATLLGGLAIAAAAHAAPPASGNAAQTCAKNGVQQGSAAWELCLSHVTRAYEWGEATLASQLARAAGDARENCLEHGVRPNTGEYRACVNKEIDAKSDLLILGDDQSGVNVAAAQ